MYRFLVPASLFLLVLVPPVHAKDLKVLTGAGMSMPVRALAAEFGQRSGNNVTVVSDTAGGVQKRILAGEKFDLVIGTTTVLDKLTRENKVSARHADLAQMVAGISAKTGTAKPGLADSSQVKATLLAAKTIAYVDPISGGITGVFFLAQADRLGIGEQVRTKAVLEPNGSGVAEAVAGGKAQYGVTLISEMLPNKGVTVWPLPDDIQMTTIYTAAVATNAENAMDAEALLNELRGAKGRDASIQAGLKPVSN
jgi:molybdate transport system substrate-binding protein